MVAQIVKQFETICALAPEEIAALIASILEQPSMTGQSLTIDNGQTM